MLFNYFRHLQSMFSIRQKLWVGFVGMLLVLATIVFITLSNITETQNKVAHMSNDIQPAVVLLMRAQTQIKQAIASLGFFLLTKTEIHKTKYHNYLYAIKSTLEELKTTQLAKDDENTKQLVPEIEQFVNEFTNYDTQLFELTSDHNKNYPAIRYANENLNPIDQELIQALSKMILSEKGEPLSEKRKQLLSLLNDFRYFWSSTIHHTGVFLTHGNKEALENANQYRDKSGELIKLIQTDFSDILNLEESGRLPLIEKLYYQRNKQFEDFQKKYGSENTRADVALISEKISPILQKIDRRLNKLLRQVRTIMDVTSNDLIDQATSTTKLVSILSLTGASVFLLLFWILSYAITAPIKEAVDAMDDIAMGYGDLTRRLDSSGRDELSALSNGFNSFVGKVQEIIVEVRNSSEELTRSAQDMANDAKDTSDTVLRQKVETDQVASAINEMSITSQEVLKNVVAVSEATKNVSDETQHGKIIFAGTIESVQHLNRETQSLTQLMETLGKEIQDIGTVLDVIQNITEQTNLLALNAAIEAARAGDHGRGFSVVADEVRALATKTTKSTQEIKSKIDGIQKESQLVMERTGKNHDIAQSSAQLALNAEKSLELIANAVADATDKASQIASMAHEQSAVAEELSKSIENISSMADHTSQVAEKVFNDSERQRSLSESVQTLLSRFKT